MQSLAYMKRERNFKRAARRMSVDKLRLKLLTEFGRLNNSINNVGVVFDHDMSVEKKREMVTEVLFQCAYISNIVDYLFEKLASLKVQE